MSDAATIALGLDTSGMKSGAADANRIIDALTRKIAELEKTTADLANKLKGAGNAIKGAGDRFDGLANSSRGALGVLSGLGGPVGVAAGKVEDLGRQALDAGKAFGVFGGAVAVGVAAVAAAAAGFAKLSIDGARAADKLLDVAEATGLTIDQVQRLGAAFARSGEDVGKVEQAFTKFQSTVVQAIRDPTSEAARSLRSMGVDAQKAGKDVGEAFVDSIARLKEIRSTAEGAAASNETFGRSIGALARSSNELSSILKSTRKELEDTGIIANNIALGSAAQLDSQISRLSHSFETFTIILNGLGLGAGNSVFSKMAGDLEVVNGWLNRISKNPFIQLIIAGTLQAAQVTSPSNLSGATPAAIGGAAIGGGAGAGKIGGGAGSSRLGSSAVDDALSPEIAERVRKLKAEYDAQLLSVDRLSPAIADAEFHLEFLRNVLRELPGGTKEFAQALREAQDAQAKLIALLNRQQGLLPTSSDEERRKLLGLIPNANPPGPNEVGAVVREQVLGQGSKTTIFDENQRELLNREFGFVFEDFYRAIITGRAGLKEAFAGLAFGILDTFATAMLQAMQKTFIDPLVDGLTNLLTSALDGLFGGLSGGGAGKGIGKALGVIGKFFGGLFADGGTLGAGKWGVAGEKGPELIYSGSRPMTVMPNGAGMGGGGGLVINFAISTPTGSVPQRTQDQIADSVYQAVQRAQRQRGA